MPSSKSSSCALPERDDHMRRLRDLQMMAGMRKTGQERRAERQIRHFRRERAIAEQQVLLIDKIRERESGAQGSKPMPYSKKP